MLPRGQGRGQSHAWQEPVWDGCRALRLPVKLMKLDKRMWHKQPLMVTAGRGDGGGGGGSPAQGLLHSMSDFLVWWQDLTGPLA